MNEIGQGAYGIVIQALDLKYNRHVINNFIQFYSFIYKVAIKKLNNIEDIVFFFFQSQ